MMSFNFHSDNPVLLALQMIMNICLGVFVWGGWLMWVTGLRLSKEKRARFKILEREFREVVEQKWEEYKRKNTWLHTWRTDKVDVYGNLLNREYNSKLVSPGRRSNLYLFCIAIISFIFCFLFEKITDYNSYLGILVYLGSGYFIWRKFYKYLLYDQWYMRFIYSVAIYITFFVSFLQIIDSFQGTNKI